MPIFPDLIGFRPVTPDHGSTGRACSMRPASARRARQEDRWPAGQRVDCPACRVDRRAEVEEFHSLAVRDLERGRGVGLPSGEAIARHLDEEPLTADEVGAAKAGGAAKRRSGTTCCAKLTSDAAGIDLVRSARGSSARCLSVCSIWTGHPCVTRQQIGSRSFRSLNCSPDTERAVRQDEQRHHLVSTYSSRLTSWGIVLAARAMAPPSAAGRAMPAARYTSGSSSVSRLRSSVTIASSLSRLALRSRRASV